MERKNPPLGYKFVDGKFEIDEIKEPFVKFIFEAHNKYTEHPPVSLVEDALEEHKADFYNRAEERGEDTENLEYVAPTYEEAEKLVSYQRILDYIANEIRCRYTLYLQTTGQDDVNILNEILQMKFEEVETKLSERPKKAVIRTPQHIGDMLNRGTGKGEPIISEDIYAEVQKILNSNSNINESSQDVSETDISEENGGITMQ